MEVEGKGTRARARVVVLEGTPREIGLAHGRMMAREIRYLLSRIDHHIFRRVDPVRGTGLRIVLRTLAAILNIGVPARLREEMRAVAEGSGIDYEDILLINCLDDALNILRRLAPRAGSLGCSSFAILGRHTGDGNVLHGRNLDYHFRGTPLDDGGAVARLLLESAMLFVYRPRGRASFVSVGWPGTVGVSTAMNEEGIALGSLTSYVRGTTPKGTPATMVYRETIEEGSTLEEAQTILRSCRRTIGNNLLVSSGRENDASLFEITKDTVEEVRPEDDALVTTNHFTHPTLAERQRQDLLPHSVTRWKRMRALCAQERVGTEQAARFLGDCECSEGQNPFGRIANEGTAISVLFRPTEMEMWIGTAPEPPASSGEFERHDVADLLRTPAD